MGVSLAPGVAAKLLRFGDELLKWNRKVNLTAVTAPAEVIEKHFLDSLAVVPEIQGGRSVLDVGAGAGFPGIPLKIALPELDVTLVDTVGKKVGFMKHALATFGLAPGARALHVRIEGHPEREGLQRYDRVVARAFTDLHDWLPLAKPYLAEGGHIVAMLGRAPPSDQLNAEGDQYGLRVVSERRYTLPFSGDPRAVVAFSLK
ncbi:MAG: 16S rRNA (guanine(527)-N(7))-methyltransferase RsmG [Myxococcaceae bacterium]